MAVTEFVLVRHGETQSNVDQLLHGRTDVPLTLRGEWQAQRVAQRVHEIGNSSALYSSPLIRAHATALRISELVGLDPVLLEELTEHHFGDFEGFPFAKLRESHPEIYLRALNPADVDFRFPNGESRREFNERVKGAFDRLAEQHEGERIVIVAHGGVIASGVAQLTGGDPNDWAKYLVENCSVTHLELNGDAVARMICWNDAVHLQDEDVLP
ncbi:MAG TPA: histidine phosphatase family protein [Nitrolancea sp.]|jgi:broad specificity phosphatase PhoE|nr:histidine phosphatase family protein [Nitrolancea sp.]